MGMFYNVHKRNNPSYSRVDRALEESLLMSEEYQSSVEEVIK